MEREPDKDETDYNIFRRDDNLELSVVEENRYTGPPEDNKVVKKRKKRQFGKRVRAGLIMLLAGVVLLSIALGIAALKRINKEPPASIVVNTQSLDAGTLNKLTEKAGGSIKQQLTITPDTLFKNNVEIQGSENVHKDLTVGGTLVVQSGLSLGDNLDIKKSLRVGGTTSLGGDLSINGKVTAASLSVGSITISSINVSSNLVFGGHIMPYGAAPSVKPGPAASGGTATVSGNDTAGTVTITVGNGTLLAGEMAIITFRTPYTETPRVQLTPIGEPSSNLRYFATRSAGFLTIETGSVPVAGKSYSFDYLVTQ